MRLLTLGTCALGTVAKIVNPGCRCRLPLASFRQSWDTCMSTLRVCMLSCQLPRAFLWYPLTLWLHVYACMAVLGPKGVTIILDMQYCSVYFSLVQRLCIVDLQDVLKKLANHTVPKNRVTVREVELMSAPQYRVR